MNASLAPARQRWLVLAVVSAAQFLSVVDLWAVNIAFPAFQRDFAPATLSNVAWILNVYAIVLAAMLIPAGRLADNIGRRKLFLAGLALFGAASLGCATAPTLAVLLVCRALQALGAAVLLPTSLGLALPVFAEHERGTAVGIWASLGAFAALIGPVLGGLLVESSWRWIFLINVPVVLVSLAVGAMVLPRDETDARQRIDVRGTVLVLAAVGLLCAALTEAPEWSAPLTWTVLGVGLVLSVAAFAPGLTIAGVCAPVSARIVERFGARSTILTGAALFGVAAAWRLLATSDVPAYWTMVLPTILLWGLANALIQPTLFRAADAVPRADVAAGSAVLSMARQLGSSLGVALLVVALGSTLTAAGFDHLWELTIASAVLTGLAGSQLRPREATPDLDRRLVAAVER